MNNPPRRQYRQGDVLLELIEADPRSRPHRPVPRDAGRVVLAYGEATGHAHAIEDASAELIELENGDRFLVTERGVSLRHEEHDTIELPPGAYRVIRQREYATRPSEDEEDGDESTRLVED